MIKNSYLFLDDPFRILTKKPLYPRGSLKKISKKNTWVQIVFTITGPDNRMIEHWVAPQFYAGKGANLVNRNISPALASGNYTLTAEIFGGPEQGLLYSMDTRQVTFSVP